MEIHSTSLSKLFVYLSVFYVLINIDPIITIFSHKFAGFYEYIYFLLPLICLISGTVLFRMERKLGWLLLTIISTFNCVILFTGALVYFDFFRLNQEALFQLIPYGTPILYIALAGIFAILSFLLNREHVLLENQVSKNMSFLIVLLSTLSALVVILQN